MAESEDHGSRELSDLDNGPVTRSKTKVKCSARKAVSISGKKESGPPTARDSQGRDLFTRPSDGKLVYLHCCVPGCARSDFSNARALRSHVCSPLGLHKFLGLIKSNSHAIEVCGKVAPGQDGLLNNARDQQFGATSVANMTPVGILPSPPTGSDEDQSQSKANPRPIPGAGAKCSVTLNNILEPIKVQDLSGAYRTRSSNHRSQMESKTRAEEAADIFHGFTSSDSEDSNESEYGPRSNHRKIPVDRIDQHKAAKRATRPSNFSRAGAVSGSKPTKIAGGDSALVVLAVGDHAVKKERVTSPSLFVEHSERHPSPKSLVVAPEAEYLENSGTGAKHLMPNLGSESIAKRKRATSAPPVTPPAITKRLRLTDENLKRLVRSCSRMVLGQR